MGQFTINKGDFPAVATFDFPPESCFHPKNWTSLSGWWLKTILKNDGVKVSWDDDIPRMESHSKFHGSSHHQPVMIIVDLPIH